MKIQRFQDLNYAQNTYVVIDNNHCVVIDPGFNGEEVSRYLESQALILEAILFTHLHYDHTAGIRFFRQYHVPVYMHSIDLDRAEEANYHYGKQFPEYIPLSFPKMSPLEEGMVLPIPGFPFQVLHTPGHTQGSVCFSIEKHLFTGDTLFAESVGRTDLASGSAKSLNQSLLKIMKKHSNQVKVHPGHDKESTIGQIKEDNPYLQSIL